MRPLVDATQFRESLTPAARKRWDEAQARIAARRAAGETDYPYHSERCSSCRDTGIVYSRHWSPGQEHAPEIVPCPSCDAGRRAQARVVAVAAGGSGLEEFRHVNFETVTPTEAQQEQFVMAMDWACNPRGWLWLFGTWMSGKTTLARCVGNYWLELGKAVLFREEPTLMEELRETYDADSGVSFSTQFRAILQAPLLIIDDFGKAKATEWVEEKRFTIANHRLERGLPTVVTTNLSGQDLEVKHPRLAPRILVADLCQVVPMQVPYRTTESAPARVGRPFNPVRDR